MEYRFSQEKRALCELFWLIPEVIIEYDKNKINELNQYQKWEMG